MEEKGLENSCRHFSAPSVFIFMVQFCNLSSIFGRWPWSVWLGKRSEARKFGVLVQALILKPSVVQYWSVYCNNWPVCINQIGLWVLLSDSNAWLVFQTVDQTLFCFNWRYTNGAAPLHINLGPSMLYFIFLIGKAELAKTAVSQTFHYKP